jgi:adenylate kinase family enzyme
MFLKMNMPMLIIVSGFAGCGKTTFARALSCKMQIPFIDYDTATEPFIRAILKRDKSSNFSKYAMVFRETAYKILLDIAFENISCGIDIIIAGPFSKESEDSDFFKRVQNLYGNFFISIVVEIIVPEKILKNRIFERGSDRDLQKIENWDEYIAEISTQKKNWKPDIYIEVHENEKTDLNKIVSTVVEKINAAFL